MTINKLCATRLKRDYYTHCTSRCEIMRCNGYIQVIFSTSLNFIHKLPRRNAMNHPNLKNTTDNKICINHNKKILLADDSRNRLQENTQLLQQAGYCVDFASNGEQALAKLMAGACYDLIATDVYLRDMTALQLIK